MTASFFGGIVFGLIWEIFRILRRAFVHRGIFVLFEDVAYFIIIAFLYYFLCFAFANGSFRWYSFLCTAIGFVIYLLTLGKLLTKLSNCIILLLGKVYAYTYAFVKFVVLLCLRPFIYAFKLISKPIRAFSPVFRSLRKK